MARALLSSGRGGGITAFSSATSLGGSAGGASVQGVGSAVLAASSSAMSSEKLGAAMFGFEIGKLSDWNS